MLRIPEPYLLFLADAQQNGDVKTAFGLAHWAPEKCLGQLRLTPETVSVGLPDLTPARAAEMGAKTLVLGIAPVGGAVRQEWVPVLQTALEAGLDIASGLHDRLAQIEGLAQTARAHGRALHDVRRYSGDLQPGTGKRRSGRRALMVGTDCAVGKKYAALALAKAMREAGLAATFRATGQTGILLAGSGIAIDAVISDFVSGAAEAVSPSNAADHWDIIEGQGSLFHPSYAAVSLGLLHGSQPDAIVVCHEPGRNHIEDAPDFATPSILECLEANLAAARLTNPDVRGIGVSLNTSSLGEEEALSLIAQTEANTGLACSDPLRFGHRRIAERLREEFG